MKPSMDLFSHPSLTLALAMVGGVVTQAFARHARVPGLVLLLAAGALLGPDGANLIRPSTLGDALPAVVGFGVAVILFEGGMRLELTVLREQAVPIRRLVTIGVIFSAAGGAIACRLFMGWEWQLCALFGTLVIVTGPTVVTPLVRRIGLHKNIGTILEAEGVFVDAIGATIAVVGLELATTASGATISDAIGGVALRLGSGGVVGIAGGCLISLLLRWRRVIPSGLENIFSLSAAIALFELSNAIVGESGIAAAVFAGMIVGNMRSYALVELADFKEQLTILLVATLFLLLAADVRLAGVVALGSAGVLTVVALMFVVRPLSVFVCTFRTGLSVKEKLFLSWCAPRGIVAAAVASLFAVELSRAGVEGGEGLRTLVFLVIGITVTVQGLTGGIVASLLGVRSPRNRGYLILGANSLALHIARRLADAGQSIVIVDSNVDAGRAAREAGFDVSTVNAFDERALSAVRPEVRRGCIAITRNESVNLLFARRVTEDFPGPAVYVLFDTDKPGVTTKMVERIDARVLFGGIRGLHRWIRRWERGDVETLRCERVGQTAAGAAALSGHPGDALLPLVVERDDSVVLLDERSHIRREDVVEFAVDTGARDTALQWLRDSGWRVIS
jgi:NhaP-type Na+/H+ or K+/H+ antiporter